MIWNAHLAIIGRRFSQATSESVNLRSVFLVSLEQLLPDGRADLGWWCFGGVGEVGQSTSCSEDCIARDPVVSTPLNVSRNEISGNWSVQRVFVSVLEKLIPDSPANLKITFWHGLIGCSNHLMLPVKMVVIISH